MIDVVVMFFLFGLVAGLLRSELKLPASLYDTLSLFLLLAIGLKGGEGLAQQALGPLVPQLLAVIALGVLQTLIAFAILRALPGFGRADAAATAAHYGSVSVATFAVGVNWLVSRGIAFEPQMTIFLAVMEVPAIVVGIALARGRAGGTAWGGVFREVLLGRSILLLLGGVMIGWIAGPEGVGPIRPLFFDLFKGILAIFLLEMGLIAADHLGGFRRHGVFMVAFALLVPPLFALVGIGFAALMGLSSGGAVLLATLAASASYIAAPAAIRAAVPEANPGLSLTAALALTFPFNILVGIPLYQYAVEALLP